MCHCGQSASDTIRFDRWNCGSYRLIPLPIQGVVRLMSTAGPRQIGRESKTSNRGGKPYMRHLEVADVISLLRSEVKRAGGQSPWGRKNGINRTTLNKVLSGQRPPTASIIKALKLRIVFVSEPPKSQPGLLMNSKDEDLSERQGS